MESSLSGSAPIATHGRLLKDKVTSVERFDSTAADHFDIITIRSQARPAIKGIERLSPAFGLESSVAKGI